MGCLRGIAPLALPGVFPTTGGNRQAIVTGPPMGGIREAYRFFKRWHRSRGSDLTIGKRMPGILRRAGFDRVDIGASHEIKSSRGSVTAHARMLGGLFEPGGGIRETALARGWANEARLDRMADAWRRWGADPDAFVVFVLCEMVAHKAE